ncbi:uncharacterized protein LAESUDRAFT_652185 [Laetiporus sulphureus 93-53]|uniref:Uncharacterized protein n=1 Tax=Laetiporus sulphureus 93-53 TaxID=1314785 RepID=A0A165EGX3_9APHY|nr:uncharacterized protein LAESUDRAFT_652185 [Laetiporus sulphureus 93-53]KZT07029.1 hypothetical protein LAESUDRAFT_652185 [Laetiporus sulphureus 93-53]
MASFSRLSRLFKPGQPSTITRGDEAEATRDDDWYIPYNGPVEPPQDLHENRDSWGQLVSGWLIEGSHEAQDRYARTTRDRAASNASRLTHSSGIIDPTRRSASTAHYTARHAVTSLFNPDQAGGIGESPTPLRVPQEQPGLESNRHSIAGFLSFGKGTKRTRTIHHAASMSQIGHNTSTAMGAVPASTSNDSLAAPDADALQFPDRAGSTLFVRRHPYAFPFSAPATSAPRLPSPTTSQPPYQPPRKPSFRLRETFSQQTGPFASRPSHPQAGIKASTSVPNLRERMPGFTPVPASAPKGKQRWLSPETWCDAIILPRPRFAVHIDPDGKSRRIISPPPSPLLQTEVRDHLLPSHAASASQSRSRGYSAPSDTAPTGLQKAKSTVPLVSVSESPTAGPSRAAQGGTDRGGRGGDEPAIAGPSMARAPRPKSFALDDLALPSPVPSLQKVLEEGRQLEADRKAWQAKAEHSFQNKRMRSFSRKRAKSAAGAHGRPDAHDGRTSALSVLAERTMLGNQARPPKVHVRLRPSQSQTFRSSEEYGTSTGVGVTTFTTDSHHTNAPSHARTRSHAHSNSVETNASSRNRTDESSPPPPPLPSGHTHTRSRSLHKSALRLVRTTASTAATFCGFTSAERVLDAEKEERRVMASPVEKAASAERLEGALRRDDTRIIRLQDQVRRDEHSRQGDVEGVVLITPASPSDDYVAHFASTGGVVMEQNGPAGLSPVPSAGSYSGDGIGIAISTPTPSDEEARHRRVGREPLRMSTHPYARGAAYAYRTYPSVDDGRNVSEAHAHGFTETADEDYHRQRQPILVHPYAPYAQAGNPKSSGLPSAAISPQLLVSSSGTDEGQEVEFSPDQSLYAEITPGHIREIKPEDIRYSPFTPLDPAKGEYAQVASNDAKPASPPRAHPYGPQSKRTSEWGFADALAKTLVDRGSIDSGLGMSDGRDYGNSSELGSSKPQRNEESSEVEAVQIKVPPVPSLDVPRWVPLGQRTHPTHVRERTHSSSNQTIASLPMEGVIPPSFRRQRSSGRLTGHSSGSSPGMISHESSPPLSPRPLNVGDDLERFRDLFYQPPAGSRTPSSEELSSPASPLHPPGSVPIDVSSQSTRTASGLTTLARQLAEDIEDLREMTRDSVDSRDALSPVSGGRLGSVRSGRQDSTASHPAVVLSRTSSYTSSPPDATSPLRFPLDQHASLAQPIINVPEDVEESSRASFILEPQTSDNDDHLRIGIVEAHGTPPTLYSPDRLSTHLSLIHFTRDDRNTAQAEEQPDNRVGSFQSSLGVPRPGDQFRSSYMTGDTGTSRMSGLSDFPVPPADFTPEHMSVLNTYFENRFDSEPTSFADETVPRPGCMLAREPSRGTFGGRDDVGQAF